MRKQWNETLSPPILNFKMVNVQYTWLVGEASGREKCVMIQWTVLPSTCMGPVSDHACQLVDLLSEFTYPRLILEGHTVYTLVERYEN